MRSVLAIAISVSFLCAVFWWHNQGHVTVTPILLEFEDFANNISEVCADLVDHFPSVLVVSETFPYPPLKLTPRARLHITAPSIDVPLLERVHRSLIASSHVLLLPDFMSVSDASRVAALADRHQGTLLALPAGPLRCERMRLDVRRWTLEYGAAEGRLCDGVAGRHGLLLPTARLWQLADPFCRPSPECLYVQTARAGLQVHIADEAVLTPTAPALSERQRQKLRQYRDHRRAQFYARFEVKLALRGDRARWFGCTRDAPRCFGSLVGDTPDYLYRGRWTPPCCLRHLRRTARHVFAALAACGARFWLEGGSLLGAVRDGDIIPWDSDVDVGVYQEDVPACALLSAAVKAPVRDADGFVWEKAPEGRFFRVQFSEANRVHVDIFPFYSRNGTMTKDTWFASHRQDCEFPEHFLTPLETLPFVGANVTVPNRAREFLELKFGAGVVETPQYPEPHELAFPAADQRRGPNRDEPSLDEPRRDELTRNELTRIEPPQDKSGQDEL